MADHVGMILALVALLYCDALRRKIGNEGLILRKMFYDARYYHYQTRELRFGVWEYRLSNSTQWIGNFDTNENAQQAALESLRKNEEKA